jgi:hypothetical protein
LSQKRPKSCIFPPLPISLTYCLFRVYKSRPMSVIHVCHRTRRIDRQFLLHCLSSLLDTETWNSVQSNRSSLVVSSKCSNKGSPRNHKPPALIAHEPKHSFPHTKAYIVHSAKLSHAPPSMTSRTLALGQWRRLCDRRHSAVAEDAVVIGVNPCSSSRCSPR